MGLVLVAAKNIRKETYETFAKKAAGGSALTKCMRESELIFNTDTFKKLTQKANKKAISVTKSTSNGANINIEAFPAKVNSEDAVAGSITRKKGEEFFTARWVQQPGEKPIVYQGISREKGVRFEYDPQSKKINASFENSNLGPQLEKAILDSIFK